MAGSGPGPTPSKEVLLSSSTLNQGREVINISFSGVAYFNSVTALNVRQPFIQLFYDNSNIVYWDFLKGSNAILYVSGSGTTKTLYAAADANPSSSVFSVGGPIDGFIGNLFVIQDSIGGVNISLPNDSTYHNAVSNNRQDLINFNTAPNSINKLTVVSRFIPLSGGRFIPLSGGRFVAPQAFKYTCNYWNIKNNFS